MHDCDALLRIRRRLNLSVSHITISSVSRVERCIDVPTCFVGGAHRRRLDRNAITCCLVGAAAGCGDACRASTPSSAYEFNSFPDRR